MSKLHLRTIRRSMIVALLVLPATLVAEDHVTILTGETQIWTNDGDVYVSVVDNQPEPYEHLFVLQRRGDAAQVKESYPFARITFRPNRLEVSSDGETWVLRLVPADLLSTSSRRPQDGSSGLLVGFGLSHHEQPITTDAARLELRAVEGMFLNQNDSTGTPGSCSSGGSGSNSCSISCGGGLSCSVSCSLGYACCSCSSGGPSCKCQA